MEKQLRSLIISNILRTNFQLFFWELFFEDIPADHFEGIPCKEKMQSKKSEFIICLLLLLLQSVFGYFVPP